MRKLIYGLVISIFIVTMAKSDHPTGGGSAASGPIRTITAETLPKGKWAIGLREEYIKLRKFSDAKLEGFALGGKEVHSQNYLSLTTMGIDYGVTDNLSFSLSMPFVSRTNIREGHLEDGVPEVHRHGDSGGVGDITLLSQYRFVNNEGAGFKSALLFGLELPTGATGIEDKDGERFETEHQPGSGSLDPIFGIAFTKRFDELSLDANFLYKSATQGAQKTDLGDIFNYNFAISYRIVGDTVHHKKNQACNCEGCQNDKHGDEHKHLALALDGMLEFNGVLKAAQRIGGIKDENSGESLLYISPGLRLIYNNVSTYISIGIPVHQNLKGIQHKTNVNIMAGVSITF